MPSRSARARLYTGTPRNLARLARVLREGGLVAAPTETVYGLAANALDPVACRAIFRAKGRPATDPLIVHLRSTRDLATVAVPNPAALLLAKKFWPGPLTLVLPKLPVIPAVVSAGLPSVAVRVPAHPLFRRLLALSGLPLAAPSANPFGYVSPTTAEHVRAGLGHRIGHILDGGPCAVGVESTIVDLRDPAAPVLLRPGAVTHAQLEAALGVPVAIRHAAAKKHTAQVAPGLLTRHYSPRTPAVLHDRLDLRAVAAAPDTEAWVFVARPSAAAFAAAAASSARSRRATLPKNVHWLDARGDLRGAARRLFAVLRDLDVAGYTRLHLERAPGTDGLAAAINDRLARAAARA